MIPERARQLLDKDGFVDAYFDELRNGCGCNEAFNVVNDEYYTYFGKFRYSNYHSFRQSRDYKSRV